MPNRLLVAALSLLVVATIVGSAFFAVTLRPSKSSRTVAAGGTPCETCAGPGQPRGYHGRRGGSAHVFCDDHAKQTIGTPDHVFPALAILAVTVASFVGVGCAAVAPFGAAPAKRWDNLGVAAICTAFPLLAALHEWAYCG